MSFIFFVNTTMYVETIAPIIHLGIGSQPTPAKPSYLLLTLATPTMPQYYYSVHVKSSSSFAFRLLRFPLSCRSLISSFAILAGVSNVYSIQSFLHNLIYWNLLTALHFIIPFYVLFCANKLFNVCSLLVTVAFSMFLINTSLLTWY